MYTETTTLLGSETATVKRGIKQGNPLSSTLFNMVIDELIEKIAKMRLGPRNVREGIIAYADDIVLIVESAIDSELMLTIVSDTDASGMNKTYNEKIFNYTKLDLYDQVKTLTNSTDVEVVANVISYRGVIEPRSALFMKQIGVTMLDLKLITVRTLERTIVVWKNHYRSTNQRWDVVAPND